MESKGNEGIQEKTKENRRYFFKYLKECYYDYVFNDNLQQILTNKDVQSLTNKNTSS